MCLKCLPTATSAFILTLQIYVGGTYVGGSDDLLSKLQDGSFAALMQGGAAPGGLPPQLEAATKQALAEAAQQVGGRDLHKR